jgi:hypothetical protein
MHSMPPTCFGLLWPSSGRFITKDILHVYNLIIKQAEKGTTFVIVDASTYQQKISTFLTDKNFLNLQQILPACIRNIYNRLSINVMNSLIIVRSNILHKLTPHSLHSQHNSRFIKTRFSSVHSQTVLIRQHIR